MKKHYKITAAFLAVIMCMSLFSITAFAENEGVESSAVDPGYVDPGYEDPVTPDPITPDPVYTDPIVDPGYVDPGYVDPVTPETPQSSDDNGSYNYDSNTDGNTGYSDNSYSDNQSSYVYYDSNGNDYSDYSEIYIGGGQSYEPPQSTAAPAELYEADSKIDVNELSKNDWSDIASMLKNTDNAADDGTGDFAFIQKNTSKEDNGYWILFAGIACLLISAAGFTYLIVSAVSRRKKAAAHAQQGGTREKPADYGKRSDDYDDGFKASGTKKSGRSGGTRYKH